MNRFATLSLLALAPLALAIAPAPARADTAHAAAAEVVPDAADAGRLLPLQGALNARDLGGLAGIPSGRFVRTADLAKLTDADKNALLKHGVTLDIDLRAPDEAAKAPDALANDPRFKYVRISLLGEKPLDTTHMPGSLGELYVKALADNQAQFKQVFEQIAAHGQGGVLYHCTAGKDRTGMISALLLGLAGADRASIEHNYAISAYYLKPMMSQMMASPQMQEMLKKNPAVASYMGTPPQAIGQFLDALTPYGGAEGYLRKIGLSGAQVQALRAQLRPAGA